MRRVKEGSKSQCSAVRARVNLSGVNERAIARCECAALGRALHESRLLITKSAADRAVGKVGGIKIKLCEETCCDEIGTCGKMTDSGTQRFQQDEMVWPQGSEVDLRFSLHRAA